MEQDVTITDEMIIAEWQSMLSMFKKTIEKDPAPEKVKTQLEELKQLALNSALLTVRQREGIIDRCNNYLSGNWGMSQQKLDYMAKKEKEVSK